MTGMVACICRVSLMSSRNIFVFRIIGRGHNLPLFPLTLLLKSKSNCHGESLFPRGDLRYMKRNHVRRGSGYLLVDFTDLLSCHLARISIAEVRVDRGVLELSYGLAFMTDSQILLRYLSRSIELGVLITLTIAKCKTPMIHPTDWNLDYQLGDIICIATDNDNRSRVVHVVKFQA